MPPEPLDSAVLFAPAGELVPVALRALAPGVRLVTLPMPERNHSAALERGEGEADGEAATANVAAGE